MAGDTWSLSPRSVRLGLTFAVLSGAFALWWATAGAGEDSPATPPTTYAAAVAWGAALGGAVGVLAAASPARLTFPLGFGALVGAAGAIGGIVIGVHVVGHGLLDGDQNILMASAFVGAGVGWIVGAASGAVVGRDEPALTSSQARVARATAVAIVLLGVVIAGELGPGIDLVSHPRRRAGTMRAVAIADALLVAATIALVAGTRPRRHERGSPLPARVLAVGGLVLGCLVLVALLASLPGDRIARDTRRLRADNARTAWSLAEAGTVYAERTGTIPSSLETLERAGGEVMPGAQVNRVWKMSRGFCVEVGTDVGGRVGTSPLQSEAVRFVETNAGELRTKVSVGGVGGCQAMIAEGP